MLSFHRFLLLGALTSLAVSADAQEDPMSAPGDSLRTYTLGDVLVEDATQTRPPGVQRIPLAAWQSADASVVAGAARLVPSAHVVTNSRGETLLSLRGASDRQTVVFFDGAPLTLPWDQRLDLGLVPAGVVGGATVAKGVVPLAYGVNAVGGVLALASRDLAQQGNVVEAEAEGGSGDLRRFGGRWLMRRGALASVLSVERTQRDGVPLPDGAGLPFSQAPDTLRTNTDRALTSVLGRVAYDLSAASRLGLTVLHVDGAQGVAPEGHLDPAEARVRFWRYPEWQYTTLLLSGETASADAALRGALWGGRFRQRIARFEGPAYAVLEERQDDADAFVGGRLVGERRVGRCRLRAAAQALHASHEQTTVEGEMLPGPPRVFRQTQASASAGADWPLGARASLTVEAGSDALLPGETADQPRRDAIVTPALRLAAEAALADGLAFHAALGRRARLPSMRELYDDALGRFVINPDLEPERAWLLDLGVRLDGARRSVEVAGFYRRATDAIEVAVLPDGARQRVNLGGSTTYGVEAVGAARLGAALRLDGSLTLLHARAFTDSTDGLRLTETPAALGRVGVEVRPLRGLELLAEGVGTGEAFSATPDGLARLAPSVRVNLRAGYRWLLPRLGVSAEVFGRVDNVFDAVYAPQVGLPDAGREVRLGVRIALG